LVDSLVGGIAAGSTEFHVVRASAQALPEFIFSYTTSERFRRDGAAAMTGSGGQQRVPTEFLRAYEIAIPGLGEQKRIADCLSALDTQITAESHQLAALKTHKQGLMQQLFPAPEAATV
ncbi:MAG: restriction endonuclease subunit S, partial [Xanthomonadaceae bacterium]|nr:restriction endonuclease subunit S [Xanthomonadaceae bacterium]